MRTAFLLISTISVVLLASCSQEPASNWDELDLLPYNLTIRLLAPDSVDIRSNDLSGITRDVSLRNLEEDYYVQVFGSLATTSDIAQLKAEQLELVRNNPYFERIVQEDPAGFIFESKIDAATNYGFRYVHFKGDREFIFQNGIGQFFELPAIEAMYQAVQQD